MKTILCPCPALLNQARRIFGEDLVSEAFMTHNAYQDEHLEPYSADLRIWAERSEDDGSHNLDVDGIVLKFSNGRLVKFCASEWATAITFEQSEDVIILKNP